MNVRGRPPLFTSSRGVFSGQMNAITLERVSKKLSLQQAASRSFRELLVKSSPTDLDRGPDGTFWALRDLSFDIDSGETVGFIGPNGAGKSTLLKLMARIFEPTTGHIDVKGRVSALLELGTGFHPELSGRENIYLSGAIMGLTRTEVNESLDQIIEFSGLDDFIDVPVKFYSSGMYVRLGFSVAIHVNPEILLIDEVLSVGDQKFQSRCIDRITALQRKGITIILVSHDLSSVRKICQRCIWIEKGRVQYDGETNETLNRYLERVWSGDEHVSKISPRLGRRWGSKEVVIERVEFIDSQDEANTYRTRDRFTARIWYRATENIKRPSFGIAIYRDDDTHVTGPNTTVNQFQIEEIDGRGYVDYTIDNLPLLPGNYEFTATIYDYHSTHPYDHRHRQFPFRVVSDRIQETEGVVTIPCNWSHTPLDKPQKPQELL
jgi:ABC-type polysaccharide/polyol phosphate transport system ATPase subunit